MSGYAHGFVQHYVQPAQTQNSKEKEKEDKDDRATEQYIAEFENHKPHTPEWKEHIKGFDDKPLQLKLGKGSSQEYYGLEKSDPRHRLGDLLSVCLDKYREEHLNDWGGTGLYAWVDGLPEDQLVRILMRSRSFSVKRDEQPALLDAFKKGVEYMADARRRSHKVQFIAGTAYHGGGDSVFDTGQMKTYYSGKGWAIWVMKKTGRMFAGNHEKGLIHHSSFLAGGHVMCGGELTASEGKIELLSAKSGHYRPTIEHLIWALRVLETCAGNYYRIKVMVWSKFGEPKLHLVGPNRVTDNPIKWSAWGDLTQDEQSRLQARDFKSFPD